MDDLRLQQLKLKKLYIYNFLSFNFFESLVILIFHPVPGHLRPRHSWRPNQPTRSTPPPADSFPSSRHKMANKDVEADGGTNMCGDNLIVCGAMAEGIVIFLLILVIVFVIGFSAAW